MDNDSLHILRALYEGSGVDAYQLHVSSKIPPTTLYTVLEENRRAGRVDRQGLVYTLTQSGEQYLSSVLGKVLMQPSLSFKMVPNKFSSPTASMDDVSVLNII